MRGGDGGECFIDPTDDNTIYTQYVYGEFARQTISPVTYATITTGLPTPLNANFDFYSPWKMDPVNNNRLYAGGATTLYTSANKGTNWTALGTPSGTGRIKNLAIAPSNTSYIYCLKNDAISLSTDSGVTFTNKTGTLPVGSAALKGIAISNTNPLKVWVTFSGYSSGNKVFKSIDGGTSWTNISSGLPNIPFNTVVYTNNTTNDAVYIGGAIGVYYMNNDTGSFAAYNTNLPNTNITDLKIYYPTLKLRAATYGRSVWETPLNVTSFDITASAGTNGTISPSGTVKVISGTNQTFNFTPASCYSIATVLINGINNPAAVSSGSYTFNNVTTTQTISVTFSPTVPFVIATTCIPPSSPANTGNFNVGPIKVLVGTINNVTTASLVSNGNQVYYDYTATHCQTGLSTNLIVANNPQSITLRCTTNDHLFSVWIDYNNDGTYTSGELIVNNQYVVKDVDTSANFTIPSTGVVLNTGLRMRVIGDLSNSSSTPCGQRSYGQVEDYQVTIVPMVCTTKTWTAGAWCPVGTPTTSDEVIIDDTYNTTTHGSLECSKLTINANKSFTVTGDMYALVVDEVINNGTITVENNGSIVQEDNSKINTGNVIYKRIAKARNSDYVYWSSPVANYTLSGHVATGPKYIWDTTAANANSTQGNWVSPPTTLGLAQGVIVRSTANFSDLTTTINNFENIFTGVPNNGTINKTIYRGNLQNNNTVSGVVRTPIDDNHNLIGNPYPSAISAKTFLTLNSANLTGSLKIWTHGTLVGNNGQSFYQNFSNTYASSDYNSYNLTGSVFSPGLDYYIGAGQGFFVTMVDGASASNVDLVFNNTLRNKSYSNSSTSATPNFYRNNYNSQSQESKFWIDLVAENGASSRSLIGYVLGATNQKDNLHDGITKPQGSILLYSKLGEDRLDIQGKGLPFTIEDQVPMGYFAPTTGNYNLALAYVEGNFNNGQSIYVKDNLLNTYHNLSQNPYLFNTNAGEIQDRFVIVYQIPLDNENYDNDDISIYVNNFIELFI